MLIAAVLFGTTGTTQAFASGAASSSSIGAARMVVGGALMALVGLTSYIRRRVRHIDTTHVVLVGAQHLRFPVPSWLALGVAAAGMATYQVTFFAGTRANGVAIGTLVTLGTSPLWAGCFEWLFRRRRPTRPWFSATILAVVGVALLGGTSGSVHIEGLFFSLAAGAAYALELVLLKVPLDRGWNPSDAVAWVMGLAALMAAPILLSTDLHWLSHARGVVVVGWLAVGTIVVAYQLLAAGLKHLPAATVTTLSLAEPATATLLGLLVLGEELSAFGVIGLGAIIAGLVVLARSASALPQAETVAPLPRHPEPPAQAT